MKRSFFTILIITISIALFSVCIVTAADADNIDLGDSDLTDELEVILYDSGDSDLSDELEVILYDSGDSFYNI